MRQHYQNMTPELYEQYRNRPVNQIAYSSGGQLIRAFIRSNGLLMQCNGLRFSDLIKIADNEMGIKLTRRTYERLRIGDNERVNSQYIGYFFAFWKLIYDYDISIFDFVSPNFDPANFSPGKGCRWDILPKKKEKRTATK